MQYRLSTLFVIFFMVAASLASCGGWGLLGAVSFLLAALCFNHVKSLANAYVYVILLVFIGIICPGYIYFSNRIGSSVTSLSCIGRIGSALHEYHNKNGHFPPVNICDGNGRPLFSWRVEILPLMGYGQLYKSLKKDEAWNSSFNIELLNKNQIQSFELEIDDGREKDSTNVVAIIGPGTAWREEGPVKKSDLPDNGSHTVMCVEVANSGVHWAEPRDLTVKEALERMKTGNGLRISSNRRPYRIYVLLANGHVWSLPSRMPISLWRKILAGEVKDWDTIEDNIDPSAPDMVDVSIYTGPEKWSIMLSLVVWLLSVVLLFHRAIKSRPKPAEIEISKDQVL
jgi:Protein of unknown function (DUF1559)